MFYLSQQRLITHVKNLIRLSKQPMDRTHPFDAGQPNEFWLVLITTLVSDGFYAMKPNSFLLDIGLTQSTYVKLINQFFLS
jgi:hypothetical protein